MEILTIKKAEPEDAQEIIDFLNSIGGETDFLTFGQNEFPVSLKEEIDIINECLKKENSLMLVGKINQMIVSQLFLDVSNASRLDHIGHLGLSVKKSHWGQSIGKKMLVEAIGWAKKKNLVKIQLQVRTDNFSAINLYKKFNFVIEGTITQALKINNKFYDDFLMGLNLI
ncbi:GNAT family N-acetyltransferase [Legionella fairfieldensis]|uniref:GNAT family N-acetyltransferase n=1 Tax=Legionella fairfieldensis TaxID=45064 RepID=UPI00048DB8B0|nr:GNAT family N-acetyltransferase [Legionella fairfieldensis]